LSGVDRPAAAVPIALVTGSRSGIGRHVAEHLVKQGSLVVGCSRNEVDWELPGYTHVVADVGDERAVRALLSTIRKTYGRIDHVVNCAGAASMNHALLTPAATFERLLNVNTTGTFLVSREAAKLMQARRSGRIVNVSTVAVPLALAGEAAYVAAKAAVEALTRVLARELAPLGITVNAVGPGPIPTALIQGVPEAAIQELLGRMAIDRLATVEDVSNVVDFLLADASSMVTGQIIYLGGVW
jgi:3-oxoacyl-[acyl-carrier protein] reductase